jgi:hypothetical protein
MTLSMTLLRGLEDVENAALLSPCHRQISARLQLFWGKANAAGRGWTAQEHDAGACEPRAMSFQKPSPRAQPDALMSFGSSRKSCRIVLDMFSECAINDS